MMICSGGKAAERLSGHRWIDLPSDGGKRRRPGHEMTPWRLLCTTAAAAVGLCAMLAPASAHPHIWVTTRAEVVVENGAIVAIRQRWTFDEYYSSTAIDGLDTNKDGVYSRAELAELAKINVEALKDFGYFTFPRLAGKDLQIAAPTDYWLELGPKPVSVSEADNPANAATAAAPGTSDTGKPPPAAAEPSGAARVAAEAAKPAQVLTLHMTMPLAKPVLAEARGFTFGVGDPTYFIAFEPAQGDAVTFAAGAPKSCRIAIVGGKPEADPGQKPSQPGDLMAPQPAPTDEPVVRFVSATEWEVVCTPRS